MHCMQRTAHILREFLQTLLVRQVQKFYYMLDMIEKQKKNNKSECECYEYCVNVWYIHNAQCVLDHGNNSCIQFHSLIMHNANIQCIFLTNHVHYNFSFLSRGNVSCSFVCLYSFTSLICANSFHKRFQWKEKKTTKCIQYEFLLPCPR